MSIDWGRLEAFKKERAKKRSEERAERLKTPPTHHMMFIDVSNQTLIYLLRQQFIRNLSPSMYREISEQTDRRGGPVTRTEHFDKLNREDLLKILYSILTPEIKRIDDTPIDDLPLLLNESWSCPQLTERVKWRLANCN